MNGSPHPAADEPITPDLLADLQAGLLDDDTAARLRHRVRTDPEAAATLAALDRVRRELSALGTDNDSAPPLPPESARRVAVTLRHLDRTPQHRLRKTGLVAGVCAAVLAIGVGTAMLLRTPDPVRSSSASIKDLTQPAPAADLQLTDQRILALLSGRPDFGMLSDPKRRADCLAGLGYPRRGQGAGRTATAVRRQTRDSDPSARRHTQLDRRAARGARLHGRTHRVAVPYRGETALARG